MAPPSLLSAKQNWRTAVQMLLGMDYESLGGRVKRAFFGKSSTENCLGDNDDKFEDNFFL